MVWIVFLLLGLIAVGNYALQRDAIYPATIQATLWASIVFVFGAYEDMFIGVPTLTWVVIVTGVAAFSIGSYFAARDHSPYRGRNRPLNGTTPTRPTFAVGTIVSVLGALAIASVAWDLATLGPSLSLAINLRLARSDGGFGAVGYLFPVIYSMAIASILRRFDGTNDPQLRRAMILLCAVGVVVGILSSARGSLLLFLCGAAGVPLVLRRVSVAWVLLAGAAVIVLIFGVGAVVLLKGGDPTLSWAENLRGVLESLIVYIVGGIPALGHEIEYGGHLEWGQNSFRFFYALLHTLGFDVPVAPLVQEFVAVPHLTNVYTMYHQYSRDFGVVGCIAVQFAFGLTHGFLYRHATVKHPHAGYVFFFALSFFPLLTQHFSDGYLSHLSTWIQFSIYGWILFGWQARRRRRRR